MNASPSLLSSMLNPLAPSPHTTPRPLPWLAAIGWVVGRAPRVPSRQDLPLKYPLQHPKKGAQIVERRGATTESTGNYWKNEPREEWRYSLLVELQLERHRTAYHVSKDTRKHNMWCNVVGRLTPVVAVVGFGGRGWGTTHVVFYAALQCRRHVCSAKYISRAL